MSVVCQGERWQQSRLCVLCTLGKPIWASLSARAGRGEEPPAQPLSPLRSRRVIAALADEGLCSRCCKWDSSGLLAQCWDAEMLLPMWQHLISDTAGRNWWDPLNTACGWHLIIRREGERGPSWLSGLRCQHCAQGSATARSSHTDPHVWQWLFREWLRYWGQELSLASSYIRLLACSQHFGFRRPSKTVAFNET